MSSDVMSRTLRGFAEAAKVSTQPTSMAKASERSVSVSPTRLSMRSPLAWRNEAFRQVNAGAGRSIFMGFSNGLMHSILDTQNTGKCRVQALTLTCFCQGSTVFSQQ